MKETYASVIIPCFNDAGQIVPIINQIKKSSLAKEIIVVEDGSNDITKELLKEIEGIKLIQHEDRLGKAKAMEIGMKSTKSGVIVYIDSDLVGFTKKHFEAIVKPVLEGKFDMTVGDIENESPIGVVLHPFGMPITYNGERAIKKDKLIKHPEIFLSKGYEIESAMNKVFFRKYKVGVVVLKNMRQTWKYKKIGLKGVLHDLKMAWNIIKAFGVVEVIYQNFKVKKLPVANSA